MSTKSIEKILDHGRKPVDEIDPGIFGLEEWDYMPPDVREEIAVNLFKQTAEMIIRQYPFYKNNPEYDLSKLKKMQQMKDVLTIFPVRGKHELYGVEGFSPHEDKIHTASGGAIYRTTGSSGKKRLKVIVTNDQRDIECYSLGKMFEYAGMGKGTILLNCYNMRDHGGPNISRAAELFGVQVICPKPFEDPSFYHNPKEKKQALEEFIKMIYDYKVNALAVVQPYVEKGDAENSSKGLTHFTLYDMAPELFGDYGPIKTVFITGFKIPKWILKEGYDNGINIFTVLGRTEGIPNAYSIPQHILEEKVKGAICHGNTQNINRAPPYHTLCAKYDESKGLWLPVEEKQNKVVLVENPLFLGKFLGKKGPSGLINYCPGDVADLVSVDGKDCTCGRTLPIITNITKADNADLGGGCSNS